MTTDVERLTVGTDIDLVYASEAMKKTLAMLPRIASSPAAVLITGETGTGKELIARAVHSHSLRCNKAWVDVNCGALPENLIESELFGYEKGAFSGADTLKKGIFEIADGGTLFLDEVGELDPKLQVKLLRVLDGVPYYRLGGNHKVSVDVRVIAATNQPLERLVESGQFRRDLYHRLRQFQLTLAPLRERPEDVVALATYFLEEIDATRSLSPSAIDALCAYTWPGNIRELRSVILQAATLNDETELTAESFTSLFELSPRLNAHQEISTYEPQRLSSIQSFRPRAETTDLDALERKAIEDALTRTGGHQGRAAAQLGVSRRTISRKLKAYNIDTDSRRAARYGFMSPEQQLRYRYAVEVPLRITTASGTEHDVLTQNVSCGGVSLRSAKDVPAQTGTMELWFQLPDCPTPIKATGKIAWRDSNGTLGIRFTSVQREAEIALSRWLKQKQQEEGWA